jgi:hypothetical protein
VIGSEQHLPMLLAGNMAAVTFFIYKNHVFAQMA